MTQISIPQRDICDQLAGAGNVVELVSADGRKFGTFLPATADEIVPPLTLDELRRRTSVPGGKTTAEVLEQLGRS